MRAIPVSIAVVAVVTNFAVRVPVLEGAIPAAAAAITQWAVTDILVLPALLVANVLIAAVQVKHKYNI